METKTPKTGDGKLTVAPEIAAEIRAADLARVRGDTTVDPLGGLYRLKVAGLLAVLDGRWDVNLEDWTLAGMIKTASDAVRTNVVNTVAHEAERQERVTQARVAGRAVAADTATRRTHTVDGARKIATKVWAQPDRWTVRALYGSVSRWVREIWDDALDHALAEDWVRQVTEPGQGTDKRSLHPGENRP